MSLELAAKHLASRGRNGDTMLVHMAPKEVAGLQALAKAAGGTLTVNPDTGLTEANFLKSLLPTLIGAGLMFATGGTAAPLIAGISNPALIGLGIGGLETARTGSLSKGLMAGLGAYGGAGLTGSLMSAGAGAQAAAAQQAAMKAVPEATLQAASAQPTIAGIGQGMQVAAPSAVATPGMSQFSLANSAYGGGTGLTAGGSGLGISAATPATQTVTVAPELTRQGVMNQAAADAMTSFKPTGGTAQLRAGLSNLSAVPGRDMLKYGAAALAGPVLTPEQKRAAEPDLGGPNPYRYTYDVTRPYDPRLDSREALQIAGRYTPYAEGGTVEDMSNRNAMETLMANGGVMYAKGGEVDDPAAGMTGASADAFRYLMGQSNVSPTTMTAQQGIQPVAGNTAPAATPAAAPAPFSAGIIGRVIRRGNPNSAAAGPTYQFDPATGNYVNAAGGGLMDLAAGGGVSHLGDYSDGGRLLKGPGDGVSDSIPATIADKRPARLADGEFVVPARIVSELGNGSTEAGARKLYAMMDRVQKARNKTTGKSRVAVDSRADKALPA